MGFCLKKCLIETNNRNMEPTPDILNLITIDKYLKTMSKKITKYKLLDSKTYIKRKELLSKCISKCDLWFKSKAFGFLFCNKNQHFKCPKV